MKKKKCNKRLMKNEETDMRRKKRKVIYKNMI